MISNIQIFFQVNGNPFQQGLLVAFFAPLATPTNSIASVANIYNYHHVRIQPNESATHCLNISTQWYRSVLNTFAGGLGEDNLGYVGLYVVVPFTSVNTGQADITISSRFAGTGFSIPRPLPTGLFKKRDMFHVNKLERLKRDLDELDIHDEYTAEGAASSKTTTNVTYNIGDVVGNVPIGTEIGSTATSTAEGSLEADVSGLPLDKPPIASGTVPMHGIMPCNSKNAMMEPVVAMQHHPQMMHREPLSVCNARESSIDHLCGLPTIIYIVDWAKTQANDTQILNFPLNSVFRDLTSAQLQAGFEVGTPIAVLNFAQFWRADVEITIEAIKTPFHSGRLVATLAYGAPTLVPAQKNVYYNKILNFSHDNSIEKYLVKYNAPFEYLRTYSGLTLLNPILDTTMARLMITVHTQLAAPDTVNPTIQLIVSIKMANVNIYEANSVNPITTSLTAPAIRVNLAPAVVTPTGSSSVSDSGSVASTQPTTVSSTQKSNLGLQGPILDGRLIGAPHPDYAGWKWGARKDGRGGWLQEALTEDDYDDYTAESGDGSPVEGEETEIVEGAMAQESTAAETVEAHNPPCRLDIGRKFEYNIRYLEEYLRRYNPVSFIERDNVFQNGLTTASYRQNVIDLNLAYGNIMTSLFRFWSGHIGYRGFVKSESIPMARLFTVSIESDGSENLFFYPPPLPSNNPDSSNVYSRGYSNTVATSTTNFAAFYGQSSAGWLSGREMSFTPTEFLTPYSNNFWYLNVSIPFNSQYNGIPPLTTESTNPISTTREIPLVQQKLVINRDADNNQKYAQFTRAVGDDFKLQVYCPIRLWYRPVDAPAAFRAYVGNFRIENPA
jgi:hypothetical protein